MLRLIYYAAVSVIFLSSQSKNTPEYYKDYYTGCWETGNAEDGRIVTQADQSFQWIKHNTSDQDSLWGTWCIRAVHSIPFKTDVMVLRFANGDKRKFEIGVTSMPAIIYLPGGHKFKKVSCK